MMKLIRKLFRRRYQDTPEVRALLDKLQKARRQHKDTKPIQRELDRERFGRIA